MSSGATRARVAAGGAPEVFLRPARGLLRETVARFWRDRLAVAALALLLLLGVAALLAPWLAAALRQDPNRIVLGGRFLLPGPASWLGTDEIGRDVLARLLYGARVSLGLGLLAGVLATVLGGLLGALAGYVGRLLDDAVNALINTLFAVPTIFLLIMLAAYFRPSPPMIAVAIGAVSWMGVARLVRGGVIGVKARDYIEAARVVGATDARILLRHILPNVSSTLIVVTYVDIAGAILAESGLSYLGLGVQPPEASWGNMLSAALRFLFRDPYLLFPSGVAIFLTVLCLYVVGDGLRDALDPRLKE